jgi:hypothetical protein
VEWDNQGLGWESGQPMQGARLTATNAVAIHADQKVFTRGYRQLLSAQLVFDLSGRTKRPITKVSKCVLEMLCNDPVLASRFHDVFSLWSSIRRYTNLKKILPFSFSGVLESRPGMSFWTSRADASSGS